MAATGFDYDLVVIGSGPAGHRAAIQAAKLDKKVALVEKTTVLGGVSVNLGTIPSKTLREAVLDLTGFRSREFYGASYRVKENITIRGIEISGLLLGQHIRAGEALLEVTKPCTHCHLLDEIRPGLQEAMHGRRGMLCRVVESGRIRRGDGVEIVARTDEAWGHEKQLREQTAPQNGRNE